MVIADSSAWIEFLRRTESPQDLAIDELLRRGDDELATTGQVVMELLYGARDAAQAGRLQGLLARARSLPCRDPDDFLSAAEIRAALRSAPSVAVASAADCLIAAVALRTGARVLHRDSDFDGIAEVTGLAVVP